MAPKQFILIICMQCVDWIEAHNFIWITLQSPDFKGKKVPQKQLTGGAQQSIFTTKEN